MVKDVKYTPTPAGLRVLGMSDFVRDASVRGATNVANAASGIHPEGTYQVNPAVVTAGWSNEKRMGAVVADKSTDGGGARKRSLLQGIQQAKE